MKKTAVIASAAALTGVFASATVANADTVTVKSGDTVSKLAKDYNTTVDAIVNTNKLSNANLIFVGQKLEIGEATQADNNQQAAQGQQSPTSCSSCNHNKLLQTTIQILITHPMFLATNKLLKNGLLLVNLVAIMALVMVNTLVDINYLLLT